MQWLSLGSAWFALSCLIILAMYLLKKRYSPRQISSHLLWQQVLQEQEANKPWQVLKRQLLLLLQLLIALLLVTALMEPAIEKQLSVGSHTIIVMDRSLSMATQVNEQGHSFLEEAKSELKGWINEQWNGGAVTVIVNGDYPEIILNREQREDAMLREIDLIEPYYGSSDDDTAVSLARALSQSESEATIYYYVDDQFRLHQAEISAINSRTTENWVLYGEEGSSKDERIRSFTVTEQDGKVQAFVTVLHHSSPDTMLELTIEAFDESGRSISEVKQHAQATETGIATFVVERLKSAHYYVAKLHESVNDHNVYNNSEYGMITAQQEYSALLISEGSLFIEKALQLMNVNVTKLPLTGEPPSAEVLSDIQFIIVDGDERRLIEQEAWSSLLSNYPLWIFDKPSSSNEAKLKLASTVIEDHPVMKYFSMEDTYISRIRALSSEEIGTAEVLLSYGGVPAILAGLQGQKPYLRFAFSLQDSDMPLRATFPILMMNSIEFMTSGSNAQLGGMLVHSEPALTLSPATASTYWKRIEAKAGGAEDELSDSWRSESTAYDEPITAPGLPGVYSLVELNEEKGIISQRSAIVKADISEFSAPSISEAVSSIEQSNTDMDHTVSGHLSYLLPYLAAIILLLLLSEWEVYRRGL